MALGIKGWRRPRTFIGLVLGGLLAPINWRLIFLVSVPIGPVLHRVGLKMLRDLRHHAETSIDWAGNVTFAVGLIAVMVGITYGIEPYEGHTMGWMSPVVIGCARLGIAMLIAFAVIEHARRADVPPAAVPDPRLYRRDVRQLPLRGGRGGLMFMLIIWLQGIWLPAPRLRLRPTPLWAGIPCCPSPSGSSSPGRSPGSCPTASGPAVRTGWDAVSAHRLLAARAAAGGLQLLGLRPAPVADMGLGNGCSCRPTGPG